MRNAKYAKARSFGIVLQGVIRKAKGGYENLNKKAPKGRF